MKIRITEKQLNEVLGVNMSYLNPNDSGVVKGDYDSQISVSDEMTDDTPTPTVGDRISKSRAPRSYFGSRRRHAPIKCSKSCGDNIITETNQELVDKKYIIPDNIMKNLQNNLTINQNKKNVDGIMRLKNLVNMKNITTGELYRLNNYFNNANKDDYEYKMLGGDEMKRWVEQQIKTATNISRNSKEVKKEIGIKNAFIKNHTKSGSGTAHSNKNNGISFSYEE